jgi:tripeptidyl-peptidase-1
MMMLVAMGSASVTIAAKANVSASLPPSCPYVTVVGTRNWEPEVVGSNAQATFLAGGGFSNYFSRPRYQCGVVNKYVTSLNFLHAGLYNREGRGYPNISARAYHHIVIPNGTSTIFDGTRASTLTLASIFALINDALAYQGQPALGWLNPWIHSEGFEGFRDVVAGSNTGCNTAGFPAKEGWDAASGFGTPAGDSHSTSWSPTNSS